jgi:hypothetical protein
MMDERYTVVGKEVYCFLENGNHTRGFISQILYSKRPEGGADSNVLELGACIVDHGEEKKTWLLDQMLPVELCPDGLVRLLDKTPTVSTTIPTSTRPVDPGTPDRTEADPNVLARETEEPLFLAYDASQIKPEMLAQAKGRPFMGPDGTKLGDILSVKGTTMIVEVDAYLADSIREQMKHGKGPAGCQEYKFPKRDTTELLGVQ